MTLLRRNYWFDPILFGRVVVFFDFGVLGLDWRVDKKFHVVLRQLGVQIHFVFVLVGIPILVFGTVKFLAHIYQ